MLDRRLTIEAKAIYSYFCSYAGAGSTAFPSRDKICDDLGISTKRYYRHLNLLKELGYIKVEQIKKDNNKFSHNIYTLVENPEPEEEKPDEDDTKSPCSQNDHTGKKPCGSFAHTQIGNTQNDHTNNNRYIYNNNNILYNQQSVSQGEEGSTDKSVEEEFEIITENSETYLYKEQERKLLEDAILKLLKLKELKVKEKTYNKEAIRYYLYKLDITVCDYAINKYRQAAKEQNIKKPAMYFMVTLFNSIIEKPAIDYNPYAL